MKYMKINEDVYVNLDNVFGIVISERRDGYVIEFYGSAVSDEYGELVLSSRLFPTKEEAEEFLVKVLNPVM